MLCSFFRALKSILYDITASDGNLKEKVNRDVSYTLKASHLLYSLQKDAKKNHFVNSLLLLLFFIITNNFIAIRNKHKVIVADDSHNIFMIINLVAK